MCIRDSPAAERDYYLERRYPSFGNLVPRDVASRNSKAAVSYTHLDVYKRQVLDIQIGLPLVAIAQHV